ncbi:MAG: ATPase [Bacteroidetes bacterium]|nr:MAG: ATPase [Bacteroidota bacterium]
MDVPASLPDRIRALIAQMSYQLYEKEHLMRLALLAAISGESMFLLGPPGVAKSMIARRLKFAFREARAFEYLMGKFSTPDEVFGPVSIRKLKEEDKYERLTDKYLPGAQIVFLDEIWKASPPIQNALLTVLNEKIYRNGEQEIDVQIRGLIAASNELPLAGEGLDALWDRFLLRMVVHNIEEDANFNLLLSLPSQPAYRDTVAEDLKISEEEYRSWQAGIDAVAMPRHILGLINYLRRRIRRRNEQAEPEAQMYVSDRRWRKIAQLLRTSAFLHEREEVHVIDTLLIADCIWNQLPQIEESQKLVLDAITTYGYRRLVRQEPLREELAQLQAEVDRETNHRYEVPVERLVPHYDKQNNLFYRLPGFWGENDAFLRQRDWEDLPEKGPRTLPLLEQVGGTFRPFRTYEVRRDEGFSLLIGDRRQGIETETQLEEKVEPRTPAPELVRIWNNQTQLLLQACAEMIEAVEARRVQDAPHLRHHLFLIDPPTSHILDSLEGLTQELLQLKLEIQKIRHHYESLATD